MPHINFIKKIGQESPSFEAIMNILSPLNDHAEEGRKFLCLVDHIVDFYLLRESASEDEVKMPIVYFPLCEDWVQKLCEEFIALKVSLLWGDGTRMSIKSSCKSYIYLPEKVSKKTQEAFTKQYKFKKSVVKHLTDDRLGYPAEDNQKCFVFSRSLSDEFHITLKTKGHYHFCRDLMGLEFSTEKSTILLGENESDVYDAIEKNDGSVKIPNIFLFLQKDMDGRNTPLCMQMQRATINEYNEDYDTGILNVFFFVFSQKPYRLQRIYENKHNLVERLQREKVAETRDFISFTKEEMDYLFSRKDADINIYELGCKEGYELHEIKNAFDLLLQDMPHEVKLRNQLAICFTERSRTRIKDQLLELNPEANNIYLDYFLQFIKEKYDRELSPVLLEWINFHQIAVVLDYNVEGYYKEQLKEYLISECGATSVKFYTFKGFKAHKDSQIFLNSITENKILVLSMLNHCTGHNWAIYPNSFDQYHLNAGQSVLQINNRIVFDPRFSWYVYRYAEQQKQLLNSNFRINYMKNGIPLPQKPTYVGTEPKEDEDEQDIRSRQSGREQKRISISFGPRQHKTMNEDDLILCAYEDEINICPISDVIRDFESYSDLMVQPLEDFYRPLEIFIDNEEQRIGDGESLIRNDLKFGLSEEEIKSSREMWKILLEHRVAEYGEKIVYNEIMKSLLPIERIQLNSFKRWLDPSENSILPRSRRMQKRVIEEYLRIDGLYTRILRHRKSRTSTNTEDKNTIFRTFLTHCLLEPDTQKAYTGLSNEVRDYLNIANGNDIKDIVALIKEETLNLRQIKSIRYYQR